MSVTEPFDPTDVIKASALPDKVLEAVIVPLAVNVNVPLVDVMAPLVPRVAEPPVVVTEKSPPTEDAARVTAPALVM